MEFLGAGMGVRSGPDLRAKHARDGERSISRADARTGGRGRYDARRDTCMQVPRPARSDVPLHLRARADVVTSCDSNAVYADTADPADV